MPVLILNYSCKFRIIIQSFGALISSSLNEEINISYFCASQKYCVEKIVIVYRQIVVELYVFSTYFLSFLYGLKIRY